MEEVSAWELDQQVISGVRLMADRADLGFAVRVFTACRASAGRAAEPRSTVGSMNGLSVRYIQFGIFTAHPNRMST